LQAAAPAVSKGLADVSRWLVPTFACFLLVVASLSSHLPHRTAASFAMTNLLLPAGNHDTPRAVAQSSGHSGHSGVNAVPAKRLEWSFGARGTAGSAGALLISYTNKLIQ